MIEENCNFNRQMRVEYFDIFRAVGIILMVIGHVGSPRIFSHFYHAFHMPIFFFASGWFFNRSRNRECNTRKFIYRKIQSLLVPYVVFGIFSFLVWSVICGINISILVKTVFWINTNDFPISGALWFLTAMFFSTMIYFFLNKIIANKIILGIVAVGFSVAGCWIGGYITLPFAFGQAMVGTGFIYFGNMASENEKIIEKILMIKSLRILCIIILFVSIFFNSYIDMRLSLYGEKVLFYLNAILASLLLWYYSRYLYSTYKNHLSTILCKIGKNSIVFLCLNQLVIMFVKYIFNIIFPVTNLISKYEKFVFIYIIVFATLYLTSNLLLNNSYTKKLFGRE